MKDYAPEVEEKSRLEVLREEIGEEKWLEVERLAQQEFRILQQEREGRGEIEEREEIDNPEINEAATLLGTELFQKSLAEKLEV